jgi:signal transduction histidine kinase/ActR/RegA family two-component response regulator
MSLRTRLAIVALLALIIFVAAFYAIASVTIDRTYVRIDNQNVESQVLRARSYMDYVLESLGSTCADWAYWDDTYNFTLDHNAAYIGSNLSPTSLATLHVDAMVFLDKTGKVDYSAFETPASQAQQDGLADLVKRLHSETALWRQAIDQPGFAGCTVVGGQVGIVAVRPILTSAVTGPARGVLLFLRYTDSDFVATMGKTVGGPVSFQIVDQIQDATIEARALALLSGPSVAVGLPEGTGQTRGFTRLSDFSGSTSILLSTSAKGTESSVIQRLKNIAVAVIVMLGMLMIGLVSYALNRTVIRRITSLGRQLSEVEYASDLKMRVQLSGSDELGKLAADINAMLSSLERTQQEKTQLIDELERNNVQLLQKQAMESIGTLAAGIAHDFNNVLTVAKGSISLAEAPPGGPVDSQGYLQAASAAVERAQALAGQLLTFARGGAPVKENLDVVATAREAAGFALAGSSIALAITVDTTLAVVHADRGQLLQVLQNVMMNARDAMSSGGTLNIAIHSQIVSPEQPIGIATPGDCVIIDIADTGPGIAPENMDQLFVPFFTTKATGHGIGLASARSIIRRHGGDLVVSSTPGKGTTVRVCLPAAQGAVAEKQPTQTSEEARSAPGRVLVMDDEETVASIVCAMARRLGWEAVAVHDGQAALDAYSEAVAEQHAFDVVIMDLTIPGGMGGHEAVQKLHDRFSDARVIVSSGYSDDASMAEYTACGFVATLAKPFTLEDLTRALREATETPLPTHGIL